MAARNFERVLIKVSGEMMGGPQASGIDGDAVERVAEEIANVHRGGRGVAVVVGGGNIFRGSNADRLGMERAAADYMGMMATIINGLALQAVLEGKFKLHTRVLTAIHIPEVAEPYIRRKALKHLEKGRIILFAGGTGNPLFTTDTAAALRAREISADVVLKATKVDGVYDKDPTKHPDAKKYGSLSYIEVISKKLDVMDATAITMCMEAGLPIIVFKMEGNGSVLRAIEKAGEAGTIVK